MTTENLDAQMEKASKTLATMLDYLGLNASIKAEQKGQKIALVASSDDAGRIIGRKGQSLESLQLLINRMMQKGDPDFPRIFIDVDGYSNGKSFRKGGGGSGKGSGSGSGGGRGRGERNERGGDNGGGGEGRGPRRSREDSEEMEETLRQQALDAAKEVRRWGESVTLPAMNAHDRRIIHITLQEEGDILTESEGEGSRKKVIVSLKK